jgi:hypothetical protein
MGFVCVNPTPAKVPPCGARLGGLINQDGSLTDPGVLRKLNELFYSADFLKLLYDKPEAASAGMRRRASTRPGSRRRSGGGMGTRTRSGRRV